MDRLELRSQNGKAKSMGAVYKTQGHRPSSRQGPCVETTVSLVWRSGLGCSLGLFCPKQLIPIHLTSMLAPKWLFPGNPSCPLWDPQDFPLYFPDHH